jgi:hypothetical protein
MNLRSSPGLRYYFWAGLVLILLFTVLKPAGTDDIRFPVRLLIWTFQVGLLLSMLIGLHRLLQANHRFDRLNPWLKLAFSGIFGSALFVPFGLGIDYLFQLDDWSGIQSFQDALPVIAEESIGIVSGATLTWIALNAPRVLQLNFTDASAEPDAAKVFPPNARYPEPVDHFLRRVPAEIGNDVIYLQSELHYVRVVTTAGERLVLFNLKDAIADLEKRIDGIQTHRSYWVAGTHARALISHKNKKLICTTNDHRVPVSRRKLSEVRHFLCESKGRP